MSLVASKQLTRSMCTLVHSMKAHELLTCKVRVKFVDTANVEHEGWAYVVALPVEHPVSVLIDNAFDGALAQLTPHEVH